MSDDVIEVAPSEEQGNIPLDAPNEQPIEPVVPAEEPKEVVEPATPTETQLFELPDGRKVDGETLAKEWKDNFLPEFTRKSQTLAEIEKAKNNKPNEPTENPYEKPDYVPSNYEEIISVAEKRAIDRIKADQQAEADKVQQVENEVASQLAELKKSDPNLNENALFLYANQQQSKYGVKFPDLKTAYRHMKDVSELTKTVQQETAKNISKRNDPVSATSKAGGNLPSPKNFNTAGEYLQAIRGIVK